MSRSASLLFQVRHGPVGVASEVDEQLVLPRLVLQPRHHVLLVLLFSAALNEDRLRWLRFEAWRKHRLVHVVGHDELRSLRRGRSRGRGGGGCASDLRRLSAHGKVIDRGLIRAMVAAFLSGPVVVFVNDAPTPTAVTLHVKSLNMAQKQR